LGFTDKNRDINWGSDGAGLTTPIMIGIPKSRFCDRESVASAFAENYPLLSHDKRMNIRFAPALLLLRAVCVAEEALKLIRL